MIPVNCRNTIFIDLLQAIDAYCLQSNLLSTAPIINPFVNDPSGIDIIQYYDHEAIQKSTSPMVIVDLITEGFNIIGEFKKYPTDKHYIIFTNGWWDKRKINLNINYEIIYWNYFLYDFVKRATCSNIVDFYQDKNYKIEADKRFTFISTIGGPKPWRDTFVQLLIDNINFDNYILNYNGIELKQPSRELDINYNFNDYNSYRVIHQHYTISSSIPINMYNASRLLLVVETTMNNHNEFHLTEKTLKALITGIPFIIVGSYNFLRHLQDMGFRTFNELWSEEYDNISDIDERMLAIINLLNQINTISWTQTTIDKAREITYYNKCHMLNVNSIMKKQLDTIIKTFNNYTI